MTLDRATLKKLEDAIPALGEVHELLADINIGPRSEIDRDVARQAREALWHWPELIDAAKLLHDAMEEKTKGRFHSLKVKP